MAVVTEINYISKYIKLENSSFKLKKNSQYYCFIFDQINAALLSVFDFLLKHKKSYRRQTFEW